MTPVPQLPPHVPAVAFVPVSGASALADPAPVRRVAVDVERPADADAREALLDGAFGPARFAKTCERLRTGRRPAAGLSLVARSDGTDVVGTVRLWHVAAGQRGRAPVPALMLGPLAVDADWRRHGVGSTLMTQAVERARALGHAAILLVGDAPYYRRFGFARRHALGLRLPGPVDAERFLGLELVPGALAGAVGLVRATGAVDLNRRRGAHTEGRRAA